jgi:hypothetical protein
MPEQSLPLPKLVGFNGYARSGKDTLAGFLVAEFGYRRIAFADALRNFITATNEEIRELVDAVGWDVAKLDPKVRQELKDVGNAARNYIHPHVWVFAALGDVAAERLIAVSDVRFPNEADTIKHRGGRLVRVERPGVGPANDIDTLLDRYDRFDAIIQNDSTIEVLHGRMRSLLDEWATVQSEAA